MKKSRYTEEQIAFAPKQAETGTPVARSFADGRYGADFLPLEARCIAGLAWASCGG